jgi:hypothetical protein
MVGRMDPVLAGLCRGSGEMTHLCAAVVGGLCFKSRCCFIARPIDCVLAVGRIYTGP